MAKKQSTPRTNKSAQTSNWVKPDSSGRWHAVRKVDSYGSYKGQALPPPGRNNIIVRTPNPLPSPKEADSK